MDCSLGCETDEMTTCKKMILDFENKILHKNEIRLYVNYKKLHKYRLQLYKTITKHINNLKTVISYNKLHKRNHVKITYTKLR